MNNNIIELENSQEKDFFIKTAYDIASSLGYEYTEKEIKDKCQDSNYLLHLEPINNSHLHIGIYPIGRWNFKISETKDTSFCCPKHIQEEVPDFEYYDDFDIIVFACHEWSEEKFKALYSNCRKEIVYNAEDAEYNKENIIKEIDYYQKNPIRAYYDLVDFDEICLCHKHTSHRVILYYKTWFNKVIVDKLAKFFHIKKN